MMRLRMYCALSGISRFSASSTARTEVSACTVVQTPQKRCVKSQASRGSRPTRIRSMPRHIVDDAHAFCTSLLSTSTSMRRCPSMRVIGSMVMRLDIAFSQCDDGELLDDEDVGGDLRGDETDGDDDLRHRGEVVPAGPGLEREQVGVEAVQRAAHRQQDGLPEDVAERVVLRLRQQDDHRRDEAEELDPENE